MKGGGNERLVLLFSLFLAFSIWLIHNLSLEYSRYFQYSITVKANLEGRSDISTNSDELIVRGKSSGFYILQQRTKRGRAVTITIDDTRLLNPHSADDSYLYISSNDLKQRLTELLSPNLEIDYFVTDSLKFLFPFVYNKEVPVVAITDIVCKSQYMPTGPISLDPPMITIYGDEDHISRIDSIYTNTIVIKNVSRSEQGMRSLSKIRGVRFSTDQIHYSIPVDRYVEKESTVPVTVTNVPSNKELQILPSQVTVLYRQSFYSNTDRSEFVFSVDYNDFLNSINSTVIPQCISKPKGVYHYSIDPPFVEGVLIDLNLY